MSFVVCTLDEADHVGPLLESIAAQDHRPLEVVVVDGGSRDGTREAVLRHAHHLAPRGIDVRLVREEDHGRPPSPANARNLGVEHARGDLLILLDGDSVLVDAGFARKVAEGMGGRESASVRVRPLPDSALERWLAPRQPRIAAVAFRPAVFQRARFEPSLGYGEDEHFWRTAGIDVHQTVDAELGRHAPRTWREQFQQQRWYGRTLPAFLARMKRDFPSDFWSRTFPRHFVDRAPRALFYVLAPPLALVLIAWSAWAGVALLASVLALALRTFAGERGPGPLAWELRMSLAHLFVSSAGFVLGLAEGALGWLRGGARPGRG